MDLRSFFSNWLKILSICLKYCKYLVATRSKIFRIKRVFKFVWISFTAPSAISDKIGLSFVETVMTLDCVIIMPNGVVE